MDDKTFKAAMDAYENVLLCKSRLRIQSERRNEVVKSIHETLSKADEAVEDAENALVAAESKARRLLDGKKKTVPAAGKARKKGGSK